MMKTLSTTCHTCNQLTPTESHRNQIQEHIDTALGCQPTRLSSIENNKRCSHELTDRYRT